MKMETEMCLTMQTESAGLPNYEKRNGKYA